MKKKKNPTKENKQTHSQSENERGKSDWVQRLNNEVVHLRIDE